MDRIPNKIKWKIHALFTLYLKFWKYFLQKFLRNSQQILYFLLLLLAFTSADILHKVLELHSMLSEKKKNFVTNVIFLMDSLRPLLPTHTLNCQNLLSVTKAFCQCSLICSLLTIVILYAVAMGVSVFTIWPFQGQMTKEKLIQGFQCFEI